MDVPGVVPYLALEAGSQRWALENGPSWAIGRGDGCAVVLDSRSVSRLHALIQRRERGDYWLVDLGSRNGSFVNSRRVSVPVALQDADRLQLGDQQLVFCGAGGGAPAEPLDTTTRNAPTAALHTQSLTTIVVADIRGYTRLARTVPEAVLSQTVGTWFLRVGQIMERSGSWAQRYVGDAVMAVWVHEDAAHVGRDLVRALRAVSEIAAATGDLHRTLPLPGPLRVGAGVNTGPAIVGGADFTALGDTVNAAFRLETATKELGLDVALGERTFAELRLEPAAPFARREVRLKGYDGTSVAWAASFEALGEFLGKVERG